MTNTLLIINLFRLNLASVMGQLRNDKILLSISTVLKELRNRKGVSQEEVYNDTNIHIGRIESLNSNLTISTLTELLRYFDIRLSEFFLRVEAKMTKV